jgi:molecular chaperone HtpG
MTPVTVESFRVDLRGIVDLFSHHLYSSPRVYVRELLQNAVDAISARRLDEPGAPASITLTTAGTTLSVTDTGVGLAPDQVRDLLATVGRSSKRDDWGFSRHEFIGQFGVGLLATFLVADTVCVHSRAAGHPVVRWTADAGGSYVVDVDVEPPPTLPAVGTTVTLTARPGAEAWLDPRTVADLVELYGSLLPVTITVDGTERPLAVAPWDPAGSSPAALLAYAQDHLGLTPFDSIPLVDRAAGLRGVAYVLPVPVNPAERPRHRVHLKRMLLSDSVDDLLPDWAYFVRATIDTSELRPTASREALFDDENLSRTREVLGEAVRRWIVRLGTTDPGRLAAFLDVHHLGVKSLALHDDEMLALVHRWVPFETTVGPMTIEAVQREHGGVRFVTSAAEFRQVAQVAAARGLVVVNAGYVYDADLLGRMQHALGVAATQLQPTDLRADLAPLEPADARAAARLLEVATTVLDPLGCDVAICTYEPAGMPGLYLVDRAARQDAERSRSRQRVDALWGAVLDSLDTAPEPARPQLVLNHRHPLVRRLVARPDAPRTATALEALYGQALLQGRHPLRPVDQALLTRTMLGLLEPDHEPDHETDDEPGPGHGTQDEEKPR